MAKCPMCNGTGRTPMCPECCLSEPEAEHLEALAWLKKKGYLSHADTAADMKTADIVLAANGLKENPDSTMLQLFLAVRGGRPSY